MKKILVIDDNIRDLLSYDAILSNSHADYKVLTAEEGNKGIELCKKEDPAIIIIDVKLPDIDGFKVCKILKSDISTSHIPIIMISAYGTNSDNRLKSLDAGAESFISKPIDANELLGQIKVLFRLKGIEDILKKERDKFERIAQLKTTKLKEVNNYLNLQIRRMPIGLISWDMNFKIKSWNPAATQIFGYSSKESIGKSPFNLILPLELKKTTKVIWKRLMNGDKSANSINKNLTKSGKTIICEWTNTPLTDDKGEVIGVLSMVKDITSQHYQNKLENAIISLNKNLLSELGRDFLNQFVLQLASTLEADLTFIGLLNKNSNGITTISVCKNGLISDNFTYLLENSPCEKVINNIVCSYASKVTVLFPGDKRLMDLKIEGYVGVPLCDNHGNVIGLVVALFKNVISEVGFCESVIQIFTPRAIAELERIKFEKTIHDSEKQFKRTVEEFPYPLALTKDNKYIYLNRKFIAVFGYTLNDIPTTDDWFKKAYPDPEYRELVRTSWNQAVEIAVESNTEIRTQEWKLFTKEGIEKTCEHNMVPLGEGSLIVMNDITKRKRAELIQVVLYQISNAANTSNDLTEFLEIIRHHLANVLDTTNFYVAFIDEEKKLLYTPYEVDEKDKINSWPAEKSLTGYIIKNSKPLFITKEEIFQMSNEGEINLIGTPPEVWVGVPLILDDTVLGAFVVQSYTNPKAYDKKDVNLLEFISHQISISIQRIRHEEELKKALDKAIESDRLKSVFLSTMSHELRTPLNAIIGFSELIDSTTETQDVLRFAKTIFNSGTLLLELVEGLFDITLIEAGEIKVDKKFHNLKSIIDDVVELIKVEQVKTDKRMLTFEVGDYPFNQKLELFTDNQKLKQILLNLLKNALKFTHHGSIRLEVSKELIEQNTFIKFRVSDTGIGIPKDKFKLIFDIFRQADDTHTRKYGGAGIGLSVTQKLTSLLGGKIDVESEVGKGTTFSVFIPIITNTEKPDSNNLDKNNLEIVFPQKSILIVEDDASSTNLLKAHLRKLGVKILHANNGKEAIHLFSEYKQNIDLVLMDINMPIMNGFDATIIIKKEYPHVPIIAQTAYAIAGDRERAIASGCDDYISKPINGIELLKLIKKYL